MSTVLNILENRKNVSKVWCILLEQIIFPGFWVFLLIADLLRAALYASSAADRISHQANATELFLTSRVLLQK